MDFFFFKDRDLTYYLALGGLEPQTQTDLPASAS